MRSSAGVNVASSCQRAAIDAEVGPHALGESGEERRAERGGLLVDRSPHRHAELIGLDLQHDVHHRRATVDAQVA